MPTFAAGEGEGVEGEINGVVEVVRSWGEFLWKEIQKGDIT